MSFSFNEKLAHTFSLGTVLVKIGQVGEAGSSIRMKSGSKYFPFKHYPASVVKIFIGM